MLDIRLIRENPDEVKSRLASRGGDFSARVDAVLTCDRHRRETETQLQQLQADRKRLSAEIGALRAKGLDSSAIEAEVKGFGDRMDALHRAATDYDEKQHDLLLCIPNLPAADVPHGAGSGENPILREWGGKPALERVEDHVAIGERLRLFDFGRAAKISGSGFVCFTGAGARLERALISFLLDLHTGANGYVEASPPFLVRRDCMIGTGQLPKFEEDMYGVDGGELFLAPTAEVPVTNLLRDELVPLAELPLKFAAYTPCFRREAGSAGLGTRGLIRMHQFDKVELVKIATPETSATELESLTADAEHALQVLGLHYRVIELCTGDLGFGSQKTYDIEVWSPGQQAYLEVSSCSNFGDYQARRMNLRFKDAAGKNRFCHTLNGSGTALARLYVALIESGLQPDGSIRLPEPLHRYFGSDRIA
ncbi:MAG: serine--tRNA ligase [Terrimicrobiaceae bacterium]|nr:serine--tRNA ligase [Terrimicrobiaceae bacterium]